MRMVLTPALQTIRPCVAGDIARFMKYGAELRVLLAGTAAVNRVRPVNVATCYNDRTEMFAWNGRLLVKFS